MYDIKGSTRRDGHRPKEAVTFSMISEGQNIRKDTMEKTLWSQTSRRLFKSVTGVFLLFSIIAFSDFLSTDRIVVAEQNKDTSAYQGTLVGDWHGEVMGISVRGTFSVSVSADGAVSGTYSGFQSGTISGAVDDSGHLNAKGAAGISDWSGRLNSADGRVSGSGTWTGYGGGGFWSSN